MLQEAAQPSNQVEKNEDTERHFKEALKRAVDISAAEHRRQEELRRQEEDALKRAQEESMALYQRFKQEEAVQSVLERSKHNSYSTISSDEIKRYQDNLQNDKQNDDASKSFIHTPAFSFGETFSMNTNKHEDFHERTSLTTKQFTEVFHASIGELRLTLDAIERGTLVTGANSKYKDRMSQQGALQYGRMTIYGIEQMFKVVNLQSHELFVDLGHGIGTTCMQAACCVGCKTRGIELCQDRFLISKQILEAVDLIISSSEDAHRIRTGDIVLKRGDFTDLQYRQWLAEADVAFVNNDEGIFSHRAQLKGDGPIPDLSIATIFAQMKPGSRLISLYPLYDLGLDCTQANEGREQYSADASFFALKKFTLAPPSEGIYDEGPRLVTWSTKSIELYLYTRIEQKALDGNTAVFLCSRRGCDLPTLVIDPDSGKFVDSCEHCGAQRKLQRRKAAEVAAMRVAALPEISDEDSKEENQLDKRRRRY